MYHCINIVHLFPKQTKKEVSQAALEGGRKFVLWFSVAIASFLVMVLCLMDLPWGGVYMLLKKKYLMFKKNREDKKEPVTPAVVESKPVPKEDPAPHSRNRLIKMYVL
jgi:hypothetical protein